METVTIVGQGYVGLPLAQAAVRKGWKVYGLEIAQKTVERLNKGLSHVDDLSDGDVQEMVSRGYEATTDPSCISESKYIVVCVPTPLGEAGSPDLSAVIAATRTIGDYMKPGSTYILESTTYPGTTEKVCLPILEEHSGLKAGDAFGVAFSPERVNPGMKSYGIVNTPKLVGGVDEQSTRAAMQFYGSFIETVVPMSGPSEAETAKLLENTFRHVNIALVNEMAKFCHELGIDLWNVIEGAATKPFGFMKFTPGPGVGGHCIPIDPNYLSYEVRKELGYPFRFVELAQEINNSMPGYVVDRAMKMLNSQCKALRGSKVLLLGITYKPDIADQRQSPAVPIGRKLIELGANLMYHDPKIERWNVSDDPSSEEFLLVREDDLLAATSEADIVILLQSHSSYQLDDLVDHSKLFLDTTGRTDNPAAEKI